MTIDEWKSVCMLLDTCFKGDMSDERRVTYYRFLGRAERDVVEAAIERLVMSGQVWLPTPAELRAAMGPRVPAFEQAWAAITPVLRRASLYGEERCVEMIRQVAGDLVAGWVKLYGALRLSREPVFDPDHGGIVLSRVQESYEEASRSVEARLALTAGMTRTLPPGEAA